MWLDYVGEWPVVVDENDDDVYDHGDRFYSPFSKQSVSPDSCTMEWNALSIDVRQCCTLRSFFVSSDTAWHVPQSLFKNFLRGMQFNSIMSHMSHHTSR